MFEHERAVVDALLSEDTGFRRLYDKHHELKERVQQANEGALTLDEYNLENLKKQKLVLKDQMSKLILQYRATHQQASA